MVTSITLEGYDAFCKYVNALDREGPPVVFYFSGSKLPNGRSWCSDCEEAEPIVNSYLTEITENIIFVHVNVGDRPYWKDMACPFRTDTRLKLMVIPTLIRWNTVKRLEGSQCNKRELLELVFGDDD